MLLTSIVISRPAFVGLLEWYLKKLWVDIHENFAHQLTAEKVASDDKGMNSVECPLVSADSTTKARLIPDQVSNNRVQELDDRWSQ